MDLTNTLLIAVALAMDCFTVSIGGGSSLKKMKCSDALTVGAYFGGFQFLMTWLGWQGGTALSAYINAIDHWIALILLLIIGIKMIIEAYKSDEQKKFSLNHKILLIMAIATSIDALGVGLSYAFLNQAIIDSAIIIGIVSFLFSAAGMHLGKMLKKALNGKAEIIGGLILIGIGLKIALEHGAFRF